MSGHPKYPRLAYLFGAFFHQDWDTEGDDWPDLVRNYAQGQPAAELLATAAEADGLAAEGDPDDVLGRRLEAEFGCCYDAHPDANGPGFRPWLGQIAGLLRDLARRAEPLYGHIRINKDNDSGRVSGDDVAS